ncbi:uncharacterized protein LOC142635137 [Castanea sativa]|uniref:uncharacterized protein LOC142635137 n=1 Tax=Castanea sativa TaxID=21020 RepID=UPI003F64BC59
MDVIGPVITKASNGHEYILVAIDYFTKWVEAASYKSITQVMVAQFLKHNIICRYGMLGELIIDNEANLNGKMIQQLYQQFKIEYENSAPYRPKMNGVVEAVNKNIKKILVKMTNEQLYQCHIKRAFNKKVRPRVFEEGDLVLKKHNWALPDHKVYPNLRRPICGKEGLF